MRDTGSAVLLWPAQLSAARVPRYSRASRFAAGRLEAKTSPTPHAIGKKKAGEQSPALGYFCLLA